MSGLPLGWTTDLAVARLKGAQVTEHSDHLVVRSPDNPTYHWGNFVLVTDPGALADATRWLAVFEAAFPDAAHRAVGLVGAPDPAAWCRVAMQVETEDVLVADRLPEARALPASYAVRELTTPADWAAQVESAARENARTDEHDPVAHRAFLEGRARARRGIVAAGRGAWFGAFTAAGELVADLGIVDCGGGLARYQDVGTDAGHRRRGLAGHLLGVAARWAHGRGVRRWVILTEPDNPAGRVYRSVGFVPTTPDTQAYRPPAKGSGPSTGSISVDSEAL